jgi:hypothetical protein
MKLLLSSCRSVDPPHHFNPHPTRLTPYMQHKWRYPVQEHPVPDESKQDRKKMIMVPAAVTTTAAAA